MSLQGTLKEIKEVSVRARAEVSPEPRETLTARRGRQKRAEETLKELRKTYRDELTASAVFIIVTGSGSKEFRDLSAASKCFRADPETFYNAIIEEIPAEIYGREGVASLFDMATRRLEDHAMEIGVNSYPQMQFKREYQKQIKSREDFLSVIKKAVNDQVGAEMVGIQAINDLVDIAIDQNHKGKDTPIILATTDESLAVALDKGLQRLTRKVYLVAAGEFTPVAGMGVDFEVPEVTESSVKKVHKTIITSLKR